MMRRRVTFHTLGCRLNQAETAGFVDVFKQDGYQPVALGETTDLLVINTCSVTEGAESDCRNVIRRVLRQSPHALVAVTGCYAQTGTAALSAIPGVDLVLGNQFKMDLPQYLRALPSWTKRLKPEVHHTRTLSRNDFTVNGVGCYEQTRANLKIQDGCDFMCSFCLIPFARGRERSRDLEDAMREAEKLVMRGHQELVLTGVNIGRYASGGTELVGLIQRLESIPALRRIRISSIEPTTISGDLIEHMATSTKLCRFLHVPVQSGDDGILQAMNRRYTAREFRALIGGVVRRIPDVCVGTDVMVGFPGEEDRQFAATQALLEELPFSYLHVFRYSTRPGTAALRLPSRVSGKVMKARCRTLSALSRRKRMAFYGRYVGQSVDVLFEARRKDGLWTGLTDNFIKVGVSSEKPLENRIRRVTLTGVVGDCALGYVNHAQFVGKAKTILPMVAVSDSSGG